MTRLDMDVDAMPGTAHRPGSCADSPSRALTAIQRPARALPATWAGLDARRLARLVEDGNPNAEGTGLASRGLFGPVNVVARERQGRFSAFGAVAIEPSSPRVVDESEVDA